MASLPKGAPESEQSAGPPDQSANIDREATAVLTPAPSSTSTGAADSPTIVDYTPDPPANPSDAITMIEAGTPRSPVPFPSQSVETTLPPGTLLGQRYEIVALLGEGGMGAVYKAMDRELNRLVALKVIRPELARNKDIIDRFKQELLLAREVTHRNVIRIFDLGEADRIKFITMEYVEGEDLRALLLKKNKLSPEEAVDIIQQVCRALDAAHSVGIIHRDLKPQNIMRDKTGRILVMDFGLARTVDGESMTQTGMLVGTMDYMSPEQALGQNLDQRSDIYTLGLIFYELLMGKRPFAGDTAIASLIRRTQERVAPIADKTIPSSITAIISKCLDKNVAQRYQSASEVLYDLDNWQGNGAAASLRVSRAVGSWVRTVRWPQVTVIATVLGLAIAGYVFRRPLFSHSPKSSAGPVVSLAILPFRNASGDPNFDWLGASLAEMLSSDVGQSTHLRTVPADRVQQVYTDLRIGVNAVLDPSMLGSIAQFTNADRMVSGRYARFGSQIRIDATLQDLKRDRSIAIQIEAADEKDIPGAVDRLAASIRNNLALSSDVINELQANSFEPMSHSPAALRDYSQGMQFLRDGRNLDAVKALQSATKEDTEFALAYSRLAEAESALGHDTQAEQDSRKAVELSQNLPLAQKYFINASLARVTKNNSKAIEEYENLAKRMPDNSDVERSLGGLYTDTGEYDKARIQLSKLLQAEPKNARVLWQMGALELMSGNTKAAFDPLNQGLSLAIQTDNQEVKALILHAIGVAYRLSNKPQDALNNYQQSLEINKRLGQKWGMAASLSEMAQAYSLLGEPDKVLATLNQTLSLEQEIGAKKEAGDTLIDLGNFYDDRGRHDQALQMYKESLQIQRDSGDENYQALCLNNIGDTYFSKGQYQDALTYFQQALTLREKLKVPGAIAGTVQSLAQTNVRLGQYDQAAGLYLRALDLYRSAGDNRGAAAGSGHLATLFIYKGRYGAAVKSSEDAVKTFRELKERSPVMAEMLNAYGDALAEAGRLDEAQKVLDEALGLARELNSQDVIAEVLARQAKVGLYRGDFNSAQALYTQSLNFASRTKDREKVVVSKIGLAKVDAAKGRAREAVTSFKVLAQEADSLGSMYLSAECAVDSGEALVSSKDYAKARQALESALQASEKLGMRTLQVRAHYFLGTILRLSGNLSEASGQYQQALSLLEETRKEPGAENVLHRADLGSLYEDATRWVRQTKPN